MYCLPLDDLCRIEKHHARLLERAARDEFINTQTFSLGTYNGRIYTYTWFDEMPVIVIDTVGAPASAMPDLLMGDHYGE